MDQDERVWVEQQIGGYVHCTVSGGKWRVTRSELPAKFQQEDECAGTLVSLLQSQGCAIVKWERTEKLYPEYKDKSHPDFIFILDSDRTIAIELVRLYRDAKTPQVWNMAQAWLEKDVCPNLSIINSRLSCTIYVPSGGLPLGATQKEALTNSLVRTIADHGKAHPQRQVCDVRLHEQVRVLIQVRPSDTPRVDFQLRRMSAVNHQEILNHAECQIRQKAEKRQLYAVPADKRVLLICEEYGLFDPQDIKAIIRKMRPDPIKPDVSVYIGTRQFPDSLYRV